MSASTILSLCTGCGRPVSEDQPFIKCLTCGALSHKGCNSHCICDEIAPDRAGDSRFSAMMREAMEAKGMSIEDLANLLSGSTLAREHNKA